MAASSSFWLLLRIVYGLVESVAVLPPPVVRFRLKHFDKSILKLFDRLEAVVVVVVVVVAPAVAAVDVDDELALPPLIISSIPLQTFADALDVESSSRVLIGSPDLR